MPAKDQGPKINKEAYSAVIEQTSLACVFAAVGSLLLIGLLLETLSNIQLLLLIVAFFLAFMGVFGTHDAIKDLYFRNVKPKKGLLVSRLMMFASFVIMFDSLLITVLEKRFSIANVLSDPAFLAINIIEIIVLVGIIAKVEKEEPHLQ